MQTEVPVIYSRTINNDFITRNEQIITMIQFVLILYNYIYTVTLLEWRQIIE